MGVTSMPSEILDLILENETLAISDVVSFALTCKQVYQDVTTSNGLWKTKTLQRWRFFEKVFKNAEDAGSIRINWLDEIKAQILRRKQLEKNLLEMSATDYGRLQISHSDMKELDALILPDIGARSTNFFFLLEELSRLYSEEKHSLSIRYYARQISPYISQTYVTKEWQKFLALPKKKQTLERAMLLVAQWMQPSNVIYADDISNCLDDIARLTRKLIAREHPQLSINRTPLAEETEWKNEILDDNKWSVEDSMIIISALCKTMFTTLGFKSCATVQTPMINQVLATKIDAYISVMTIFEAVARRLGLRFEIVGCRGYGNVLLRWKERYTPEDDGIVTSHYLDIFVEEKVLARDASFEYFDELPAATVFEMVVHTAGNIDSSSCVLRDFDGIRWSRELLHMISPRKIRFTFGLINFYIRRGLNIGALVESLKDVRNTNEWLDPNNFIGFYEKLHRILAKIRKRHLMEPPKMRTPQVRYAVGMIVMYRRNMMSVITGWDATKNDNVDGFGEERVPNLRHGDKQPFYSIYCDDDFSRYVPQESLTLADPPGVVYNFDVGRYLCKFMGEYYLPNIATARRYPEDIVVLYKLYGS